MLCLQEIEEFWILHQNCLVQEFGQLVVSHLAGGAQGDQSLLEEPFVQEVELISTLRHELVFILIFFNELLVDDLQVVQEQLR